MTGRHRYYFGVFGAADLMRKATFSYTGIRVKDMDESLRFYVEVLGMEIASERERLEPTKGEAVTLKSRDSDQLLELNYYEQDSPFWAPYTSGEELDHLAFLVEDVIAAVDELRQRGVEVLVEPYSIGEWAEAYIKDPNGIWIEILPLETDGA
ncbi:MAG: VOC family protein [Thermoplasmata archaeon]